MHTELLFTPIICPRCCPLRLLKLKSHFFFPRHCTLPAGNQARVADKSTVVSTSTRNFPNRLGKGANVFLASAELASIAAIEGKLPSVDEYQKYASKINETSADTFRYLNFDRLSEYVEKGKTADLGPEVILLFCLTTSEKDFSLHDDAIRCHVTLGDMSDYCVLNNVAHAITARNCIDSAHSANLTNLTSFLQCCLSPLLFFLLQYAGALAKELTRLKSL